MDAERRSFCAAGGLLLAGCASTRPDARAAARAELGATGKLRAAINFGNPILASKDAAGEPRGVSVDLAREAGRRWPARRPRAVQLRRQRGGSRQARQSIAFVAIDPVRGGHGMPAPCVIIRGATWCATAAAAAMRKWTTRHPRRRGPRQHTTCSDARAEVRHPVRAPTSQEVTSISSPELSGRRREAAAQRTRSGGRQRLARALMVIERRVPWGRVVTRRSPAASSRR